MEVVNLKKYLTPSERASQDIEIHVEVDNQQVIDGAGFYNAIFKRDVKKIYKQLFKIKKEDKLVSVVNSLIPEDVIKETQYSHVLDIERAVDETNSVDLINYDIMLTWPNEEERRLFDNQQELQQILLKKATLKRKDQVIRYEEEAMLPNYFSLQKGR